MTESKREATHTEIAGAARQLSRDPAAQAHDLRGALKGLLNVYDEIRTAHPEAQGNKDLGEPPLTRLEVTEELRRVVLESASRWDDLATITEEDGPYTNVGFMRASAKRLRDALPPECETDVESELESASNGMGLR